MAIFAPALFPPVWPCESEYKYLGGRPTVKWIEQSGTLDYKHITLTLLSIPLQSCPAQTRTGSCRSRRSAAVTCLCVTCASRCSPATTTSPQCTPSTSRERRRTATDTARSETLLTVKRYHVPVGERPGGRGRRLPFIFSEGLFKIIQQTLLILFFLVLWDIDYS